MVKLGERGQTHPLVFANLVPHKKHPAKRNLGRWLAKIFVPLRTGQHPELFRPTIATWETDAICMP
jgi:hypothetical protein